jgi:hypothetical protein
MWRSVITALMMETLCASETSVYFNGAVFQIAVIFVLAAAGTRDLTRK